jgi:acetyl-CoA acetyltransferase family protein
MREIRETWLVGYVRTPFGRADPRRGYFRKVRSDDLGALVLGEVCRRTGISPDDVDGVMLGAVEMMGEQAHPGTTVPFLAGFPSHVVGLSIERACTTAMMSIHLAAMNVMLGQGDVYLAGGLDSMTHFRIPTIKDGMSMDDVVKQAGTMLSVMNPNPRMAERINLIELNGGQGAEKLADRYGIEREEMDQWALMSHQRAIAARDRLREEMIPVEGLLADDTPSLIDHDQGPRADTTIEKIRSHAPVYKEDGKISAATSSGQADGAAVCVVMSAEKACELGLAPIARIHTLATGACHPTDLIYSAIPAIQNALRLSDLDIRDFGLVEVNEAFACAPIAVMKEFGLADRERDRINVNGGACAIGHPVGASGARLVGTIGLEMQRRGSRYGLAAICGGMGQGAATVLELVEH